MKLAIIGTRGIPNHYGGFEQCAEYLAAGLVKKGMDVTVYNSHTHPYQKAEWRGVHLVHKSDPENKLGTAGQFIYDFNVILDCRKRNFDIILQLGYTSSSVWGRLLPKKAIVTTNMDGLEWKRTKYSKPVRKFLKYAEKLGVKYSDYLISDSVGIQKYLSQKYGMESTFIPYGADLFLKNEVDTLSKFDLTPYNYNMLVARLEPENSIEIILDGVVKSQIDRKFLLVGNYKTHFGYYLKNKFKDNKNILFLGGIFDIHILNNLRYYSSVYFHGHTVGGTNPSLLEAMASDSLICANDNNFNRSILGSDAFYFLTAKNVSLHLQNIETNAETCIKMIQNNRKKVAEIYSWDNIVNQYFNHFMEISNDKNLL